MTLFSIYSPSGEVFEVTQHRYKSLLKQGWSTAPASPSAPAPIAEPEPTVTLARAPDGTVEDPEDYAAVDETYAGADEVVETAPEVEADPPPRSSKSRKR
jgi:hypothetical protein